MGYDYYNDYNNGLSSSKRRSNAGVNAAYAVGGIGVSAVFAPPLASGLVSLGALAGSAG